MQSYNISQIWDPGAFWQCSFQVERKAKGGITLEVVKKVQLTSKSIRSSTFKTEPLEALNMGGANENHFSLL
jgi:hypothetical protein